MKKIFIVLSFMTATLTMGAVANAQNNTLGANHLVPRTLEAWIYSNAIDLGIINQDQETYLMQHDAIGQILDSCSSGSPSGVVDKVAEIAVDYGMYPDVKSAKTGMKNTFDKLRKDDGFWDKVYRILGLKN